MSKHLARTLKVVILVIVAAAPAIAIDPAFRSFITNHPGAAAYLPPAAGIFWALWRAYRDVSSSPSSQPGTPATGGNSSPATLPPPS